MAIIFAPMTAFAEGPVFVQVPSVRECGGGAYGDIIAHSVEKPFGLEHGRPTSAHETAHGIHSTYRNRYRRALGCEVNALYMRDGNVAIVREPPILLEQIRIPPPLRGYRHRLYFRDQLRYWNSQPCYVLDEWTAYICGAEVAVDDLAAGIKDPCDAVSGCLEFSIYAVAMYLTTQERAAEHLREHPQLREVIGFNLARAEAAYSAGREVFPSEKQEKLHEALRSHPDAAPIRDCLRDEFGGAFLDGGAK